LKGKSPKTGMSNMRPFASTPAARKKDTVIWSFNGQNYSFYNFYKFRFSFVKLHYFAFMNAHCMFLSLNNKNILQ